MWASLPTDAIVVGEKSLGSQSGSERYCLVSTALPAGSRMSAIVRPDSPRSASRRLLRIEPDHIGVRMHRNCSYDDNSIDALLCVRGSAERRWNILSGSYFRQESDHSSDLYHRSTEFQRVKSPQVGELVVWRGHLGIVVNPAQHTFFSALRSGLAIDSYNAQYGKERGQGRFYRYLKGSWRDPSDARWVQDGMGHSATRPWHPAELPLPASNVCNFDFCSVRASSAMAAMGRPCP
jgi:hypothetical protein